jgi:hypothetical protein
LPPIASPGLRQRYSISTKHFLFVPFIQGVGYRLNSMSQVYSPGVDKVTLTCPYGCRAFFFNLEMDPTSSGTTLDPKISVAVVITIVYGGYHNVDAVGGMTGEPICADTVTVRARKPEET